MARSRTVRSLGIQLTASSHHAGKSAVEKATSTSIAGYRWQQLFPPASSRPAAFSSVGVASSTHPKAASNNTRSASTTATTSSSSPANPAPVRDFFLDNLGKIFLGVIGLIVASLIRSSYGTSNMKEVREELEADSALDPVEISDLRQTNAELTPSLFRTIMNDLKKGKQSMMTYPEFVVAVRAIMLREKGEGVTVGMGHLLDRVVMKKLADQLKVEPKEESNSASTNNSTESFASQWESSQQEAGTDDPVMPLSFWFTVLSLALNGPVPDRIRILYEIMELEQQKPLDISSSSDDNRAQGQDVTLGEVKKMIGHLQDTCQLVPDKQVVPTETKYPVQQYKRGTPAELVQWEGDGDQEVIDVDGFAGILRSKSVCAWGECYHRKKYVPS